MMQKRWFKIFIWFTSSALFFMMAVILISYYSPAPTQDQSMKYMMGMMDSMENAMMGLSMSLESNNSIIAMIVTSASITIPLTVIGIVFAVILRLWGKQNA